MDGLIDELPVADKSKLQNGQEEIFQNSIRDLERVFKQQFDKGLKTYGVPLTTFNGRNAAEDALQEAVDLIQYLEQLSRERDVYGAILFHLYMTSNRLDNLPVAVIKSLRQISQRVNVNDFVEGWFEETENEKTEG